MEMRDSQSSSTPQSPEPVVETSRFGWTTVRVSQHTSLSSSLVMEVDSETSGVSLMKSRVRICTLLRCLSTSTVAPSHQSRH